MQNAAAQKARLAGLLFSPPHHLDKLLDDNRQLGRLFVGPCEDFPIRRHQCPVGLVDPHMQPDREAPSIAMHDGARVDGLGLADADDFQSSEAARVSVDAAVGFEDWIDHEMVEIPVGHAADARASLSPRPHGMVQQRRRRSRVLRTGHGSLRTGGKLRMCPWERA